jgi:hypothetical protein
VTDPAISRSFLSILGLLEARAKLVLERPWSIQMLNHLHPAKSLANSPP